MLPQAFKIVIPAVGNDFIALIKDTSLVSVITVNELLRAGAARRRGARCSYLSALLVAAAVYWILTIFFSFWQARLETQNGARPCKSLTMTGQPITQPMPARRHRRGAGRGQGPAQVLRQAPRAQGRRLRGASRRGLVLLGPSGSGKSTLLRCINSLEEAQKGTIRVGDVTVECGQLGQGLREAVHGVRLQCGMVFQDFNLFPHKSVTENVIEAPMLVKGDEEGRATAEGQGAARAGGPRRTAPTTTRRRSRAARSSAWRSPARWPWTPS